MMNPCDIVAERIALGEALGDLTEHAATCERCRVVVELPTRLGATRTPIDPGLGFSARMTAGAQHRITIRRRRRVVAGLATSMAATVAVVVLMTRTSGAPDRSTAAIANPPTMQDLLKDAVEQEPTPPAPTDDSANADLAALARFSHVKRVRHLSAHWTQIERPLAPYRHLVSSLKGDLP